jgi:hypothetical protein
MNVTRSLVASDDGLVFGVTRMIATLPLLLTAGSETAATFGKSCSAPAMVVATCSGFA